MLSKTKLWVTDHSRDQDPRNQLSDLPKNIHTSFEFCNAAKAPPIGGAPPPPPKDHHGSLLFLYQNAGSHK